MTGSDSAFQAKMLQGVSRSFAFTIPQLPAGLRMAAGNSYLLCRIADTIEDSTNLSPPEKSEFSERFSQVVAGAASAESLARDIVERLSCDVPSAERTLIVEMDRLIGITHRLRPRQRQALARCVQVMTSGMSEFQYKATPAGLENLRMFDRYCYHVAGVVGDTLTELFCDYSERIESRRTELLNLSASFGQGLQIVNIIKDIWEDRERGVCWLPQDVFLDTGCDLATLRSGRLDAAYAEAMSGMLAIARRHIENGVTYVSLLPAHEVGIRKYCLWALGMAALTLRRVQANPQYGSGQDVKISRREVRFVIAATGLAARFDRVLGLLFDRLLRRLPDAHAARPVIRQYLETVATQGDRRAFEP